MCTSDRTASYMSGHRLPTAKRRNEMLEGVRIWTPPHLQAFRLMDDEVRLLTYIRSLTTASLRFVDAGP